ncbi:MAG: hypothetical protein U9R69_04715 [Thermodesulfobacteriota bacterium]|nr:hypothetical protein [Thermodesulfobacteriota bacterium]
MKYLHYILTLTLAICLLGIWGTSFEPSDDRDDPTALIINGHSITADEIQVRLANSSYYVKEQQEFMEDLITKVLLIQESQRQEIDKEESFKLAIKDYYEQSLIKILIDRQYNKMSNQFTENDITVFKENYIGEYHLILKNYPTLSAALKLQLAEEKDITSNYFNLPEGIRDLIVRLTVGETSEPVAADSAYIRIQLITKNTTTAPSITTHVTEESINQRCEEELLRQAMNKWLLELRTSAQIILPENI